MVGVIAPNQNQTPNSLAVKENIQTQSDENITGNSEE